MEPQRVAIVLDPVFGNRLEALARRCHVWIVDSPANQQAVRLVWEALQDDRSDPLASGATIFDAEGATPEAWCLNILGTVGEHHAALGVLSVIGAALSDEVRAALTAQGFSRCLSEPYGFEARRGTMPGESA